MPNILEIKNDYSWFHSKDDNIKHLLWRALRFKAKGYFHNVRYKMKIWDGYDDFFKKDCGKFLTGLLPEVTQALEYKNAEYEIQDHRKLFQFKVDEVDENFINFGKDAVVLRDYQVDYVNQVIKNRRGIITSPTSSGKSATMRAIVHALPPKTPTLILANKKSLIDQNYDEIKTLGIDYVGRMYGDKKDPNYITCSTSQSAHLLKPILPKIKVLIVDEVHEMMSKVPKRIYTALKNCDVRIGMSATAFKFDGKDESQKYQVKGYFGPVFENGKLTTKKLQERGILSESNCVFYRIEQPQLPYEIYLDAVTKGIAENNYFHMVVAKIVQNLKGRTLIIVERLEHGERLRKLIPGAMWIKGDDDLDTRKEVINKLKYDEDIVAIATAGIFNTGISVFCHSLINAAGGQADHQVIQRFGRGLRTAKDKGGLTYIDFIFDINEYLMKHSNKRIKILEKQGHKVKILDAPEI